MKNQDALKLAISAEELDSHLPAYDRIELLAHGGMGAVYKARQTSLNRPVAIKTLTHACSFSIQFRKIFKQEAQVMAKLNHPSIASIYDYGEINGILYIVMQFIEGQSLFEICNGQEVEHQEAAELITNIAKALDKPHQAGILHRDIKPANIIIDEHAVPVLIDFGLAHHTEESTIHGGSIFGSDYYTAPEITTPPYQADLRSDLFALGVLFYELLTGSVPHQPYIAPSEVAQVDQRYDSLIKGLLSISPDNRPASAQELVDQLDDIKSQSSQHDQGKAPMTYRSYHTGTSTAISTATKQVSEDEKPHKKKARTKKRSTRTFSPQRLLLFTLVLIGIIISIGTITHALYPDLIERLVNYGN